MATADIVILIIVLLSSVIGLVRGLFRELVSLIVWFSAVALALYFSSAVGDGLAGIVQWLVRRRVATTGLTGTDRFLGFLFGSARGVLVCIVALIALKSFEIEARWWHDSKIIPELLAFEQDVLRLMGKARDAVVEVTDEV